jgi:Beta propeller domain
MRKGAFLIAVSIVVAIAVLASPSREAVGPQMASAASVHASVAVSKHARARARHARLRRFSNCRALLRYARHHGLRTLGRPGVVPRVGAPTHSALQRGAPQPAPGTVLPQPTAAAPAEDVSSTNVQEQDVDEPDVVKTDGQTIFAIANGRLNAVDARSAAPRLLGSLDLAGSSYYGEVMLVHGGRALVISQPAIAVPVGVGTPGPARAASIVYPQAASTLLTEIDVRDPTAMKVVRTEQVDGDFVDARLNGHTARVVISSYPRLFTQGGGAASVRSRVHHSTASSWVPRATIASRLSGRHSHRRVTACRAVRRPAAFSGLGMVSVLTIDMSKGLPALDSDSLMTDAQTVYASKTSLYVATQRWIEPTSDGPLPSVRTAIHRFDISDADRTDYLASGVVDGLLLNQWSLSEYRGDLRVASTDEPIWFQGTQRGTSQSSLTVLRRDGGALVPVGRVGGLGKGQRIYAVRFIADAGFVVTFRRIDPLYTLDVSNPTAPRVRGALELQGYSAYLHPVGDDLLLGIGQDADAQGVTQGTQLSLFDVSDLAHPRRIARRALGANSSSPVEFDHHAFLFWAPSQLAVLPVSIYGTGTEPGGPSRTGADDFTGAIGFRVNRSAGIGEAGRAKHQVGDVVAPISRSVVVGDRLFTVSGLGMKASTLDTLAERGWVAFPG